MPHFPVEQAEHPEQSTNTSTPQVKELKDEDGEMRIRVKNRRMRYLELHPEYLSQSSLELADPLLYDRLIRRFQTAAEREKEGHQRGYTGALEADLVRSEAKLKALQHPDPNNAMVYRRAADGSITGVEQDAEDRATGRQDGWRKWKEVMELRFVRGDDGDFEYADVDGSEELDDRVGEERERLEEYLEAEKEEFVGDGMPAGQTGVQDY